eukprot:16429026-Heterocapsa_arctica.AAC.1
MEKCKARGCRARGCAGEQCCAQPQPENVGGQPEYARVWKGKPAQSTIGHKEQARTQSGRVRSFGYRVCRASIKWRNAETEGL